MTTIGSLFSGIGGLELGLEWAGLGPVLWQVEIDPFCRDKLARRWPNVKRFGDVTKVGSAVFAPVDLICGGFPCQDVSSAGKGAGLAGSRSGLWFEFARIVGECKPSWVLVENVASGANRWVDDINKSLGRLGYQTLPIPLSAKDVGAPHMRKRIFVVAYSGIRRRGTRVNNILPWEQYAQRGGPEFVTDTDSPQCTRRTSGTETTIPEPGIDSDSINADSTGQGLQGTIWTEHKSTECAWSKDTMPQPALCRVDDGPPAWVDRNKRLRALGNAVVPQCAEVIGHVIKELEMACTT